MAAAEEFKRSRGRLPDKPPERRVVQYPPQTVTPKTCRAKPLTFVGQVEYVGGQEGERLRHELADVVRELLIYFHDEQTAAAEGTPPSSPRPSDSSA